MATVVPHDLLIECSGCGIENIFSGYTPNNIALCNQCRDRLIHPNFNETHNEYCCRDCGFVICLLKKTEFDEGNTPCRCESLQVHPVKPSTRYEDAKSAGAFNEDDTDSESGGGYDWCRSDDSTVGLPDDYNEVFDQDMGNT